MDLSMALWGDLDGRAADATPSALASIYDASSSLWFDFYTLSGEYRARHGLSLMRLGRQSTEHGVPVVFDGATVELSLHSAHLELFAFGGRTAHFFEADADAFEDWLASVGLEYRPLRWLRLELDYRLQVEDTTEEEGLVDHTFGVSARLRPTDWLFGKLWLNGYQEGVQLVGTELSVSSNSGSYTTIRVAVQPTTLRQLSETEDPFYAILGESLPHYTMALEAHDDTELSFGTLLTSFGLSLRRLIDDDPTEFNHSFSRYFLRVGLDDLAHLGLFMSLTVDYSYVADDERPASDDGQLSLGGAAGWRGERLRAELGTYYQRFKYHYFRDVEELADVRTVYGDLRYELTDWLTLRGRYEFERFDRDVHTLRLSLSQRF